MDKLLHHYEQELGRLREATRRYADAYPATAAALELEAGGSTDPEVERLLQSVALLNASMHKSIENSRGEFHKALLQTLQPHYLRPIPPCGIIQVDTSAAAPNEISTVSILPRGTLLHSGDCRFCTAYDACVAPVTVAGARFQPTLDLPATLRLPGEATTALCISLEASAGNVTFDQPPMPVLRLYVDGEAPLRAGLLDAILMHSQCVCVECENSWSMMPTSPFVPAGTAAEEALLPCSPGQQSPRLLTELFHMPRKFDFLDLDLQAVSAHCPPGCKRFTLHIVLPACDPELRQAGAANFRLSCTPAINLFPMTSALIRLDGRSGPYPVAPSLQGCTIYSIDEVSLKHRSGDRVLPPFHGMVHTDAGPYWQLGEQDGIALALIDREQRPLRLATGTITVQLSCMNDRQPPPVAVLTAEAIAGGVPIRFMHGTASAGCSSSVGDLCESLYSQETSLPALRKLLLLHGCSYSEGLKSLAAKPATSWLEHPMGRIHMYGTEFSLLVDEVALRGHSVHVFGEILAMTLADRLCENRFAQLRIADGKGRVLYHSAPRVGTRPLV